MHKAAFFLQELMNVTLDFDFILYKHGPFSFDLRDELTFMRAQGFLRLEPQYPYGPTLIGGEKSELLKQAFRQAIEKHLTKIRFVSQKLGTKTVPELERTATALYIKLRDPAEADPVERLRSLKPHIALPEAQAAVIEVEPISRDASSTGGSTGPLGLAG